MAHTAVRAHTRQGHQVRAHSRRTSGRHVGDVLAADRDRMYDRLDRESGHRVGPVGGDPACAHPGWYPIPHIDGDRVLAHACMGCAAVRPADQEVTQ